MKNVIFKRNTGNQVNLFINTGEVIDILPTGWKRPSLTDQSDNRMWL